MAICNHCRSEGARVRSRWAKGVQLPDECPQCAPDSFEKFADPSAKKIWTGPEFAPNDYERRGDGLALKPEAQADLESRMCGVNSVAAQEEREAIRRKEAEKRRTRRTRPMTQAEYEFALRRVDEVLRPQIEDQTTAYDA